MKLHRFLPVILTLGVLVTPAGARSAAPDFLWLDGLSLIVLESGVSDGQLHAARSLIHAHGGRIGIISPPSLMLGWVPLQARSQLVGRAGIVDILDDQVEPHKLSSPLPNADVQTGSTLRYFNAVKRGDYQRAALQQYQESASRGELLHGDALQAEPLDEFSYLKNLQDNGLDLDALAARGLLMRRTEPRITGNSDRMTGTVAVTLMFVESDGSGSDPDLYTWVDADVQNYINGVNSGLLWWTSVANNYNDCWVAFYVRYMPPTDVRNHQWREIVLHPWQDVDDMASEIMANYGYTVGGDFARVDAFNTAQRATYGTDWAFTSFIGYNPPPASMDLANFRGAFAWLLGPYSFLLYRASGWLPHEVYAHETGHTFGACDEYAEGCTCGALCLGKANDNCADCPGGNSACMMKDNSQLVCSYTDDQLGWQSQSPCAPPVLAAPVVTSIHPSSAEQGETVELTVTGSNLQYGAFIAGGPTGVSTSGSTVLDDSTLVLSVTIAINATLGLSDITISNRDLQSSTLPNAFEVQPSLRHYFAPSGTNVFPYNTALTAATNLDDAIAAASDGDSVLMASGVYNLGQMTLTKAITLSGAWIDGFTARDLVQGRSVLQVAPGNLTVVVAAGDVGLDGFIVENGSGTFGGTPQSGNYGGGLFVLSSSLVVRNCTIRNNQASAGAGFSGGGGVFAVNSSLVLENNDILGNTANRGGGIYLHNTSGAVRDNLVATNVVALATLPPQGAAIFVQDCSNLTFENNSIENNSGAEQGGGFYIDNSTAVLIQDGHVRNHSVTNQGAGLEIVASQVDLVEVEVSFNNSALFGGGINASAVSTLSLSRCELLSNSALVYGGLFADGGSAFLRHNLFAGNVAASSAAFALTNVAVGAVLGNTLDGNDGGSSTGGATFTNSALDASNNIVSNTTGHGFACSGAAPTMSYNLMWNSSGNDYSGCTPGAGSQSADPGYANAAQNDYHLTVHSPAIDAGRLDVGFEDSDGSRGDLGRYGSNSAPLDQPAFPKNLAVDLTSGNVVLTWDANLEGDLDSYVVYCDSVAGFVPSLLNAVTSVPAPSASADLGPAAVAAFYKIAAMDTSTYASGYSNEVLADPSTAVAPGRVPQSLRLHPNTPNPFNPVTTLRYELDRLSKVRLAVFDLNGRLVARLVEATQDAGVYTVRWDGENAAGRRVPSGVYLIQLRSDDRLQTRKAVLLK